MCKVSSIEIMLRDEADLNYSINAEQDFGIYCHINTELFFEAFIKFNVQKEAFVQPEYLKQTFQKIDLEIFFIF